MSVVVDDRVIKRVEILSELSLSGEERAQAAEDMQRMLTYFDKLSAVDTEGISPLAYPGTNVGKLREDAVTNGDQKDEVLSNAPKTREDLFVVPRTI
ncbi:MAG: Asp-tRNA(Asn)/Glu-tRNA(Gln) amidotransferase subunit GatC [Lachnospiraceae bacterium]|nr:Asp-tRNA(Asn)/Glu-tRNA(Gln) amidotransferase subunit GatC [Lachnospiraceae bacterium]